MTAIAIQTGINMLQVATLRMPFLFAQCSTVLIAGEAIYRVAAHTLNFLGFNKSDFAKWLNENTPELISKNFRPFKKYSESDLAIAGIFCLVVGNVGALAVSTAFGPAPAIYNQGLQWLGNIRITNELHPAFAFIASRVG